MSFKNALVAFKEPLSLANGNRRKSSRSKPTLSQKEKENIAQKQNRLTIPEDKLVEELANGIDTTEDTENGELP